MISVEEALDRVLSAVRPLPPQGVGLRSAAGRYLAERVLAAHDSPPFDTSAMDGFAVRARDIGAATAGAPVTLRVQGEVIAGDGRPQQLEPAAAIRINTGAPLPSGATAVVRIEDVQWDRESVRISASVAEGENLRRRGEDFTTGQELLRPGGRIDAAAAGLLASLGRGRVRVARRPRVALLSTGDELIEPGEPLPPGKIYNSSRFALLELFSRFGAEVHDLGCVADDRGATRRTLERGLGFDVLVTTGGVSMGSHDFVRPMLIESGVKEVFWKVRQRPGAPLFFGTTDDTLCFGLPGNPVSVFVTALVYVRAALLRLQGADSAELPWVTAFAAGEFSKKPGMTLFARAGLAQGVGRRESPRVVPASAQGSHQFSALASCAGIVRLPEDSGSIPAGEPIDFLDFHRL